MIKAEWKDKLLFIGLFLASCIFYLLLTWGEKEEAPKPNEQEPLVIEQPAKYVDDAMLNDMTMKVFLQDLMGDDFTLSIDLFQKGKLSASLDGMNELDIQQYAQEVGRKIKNNKELVNAKIVSAETLNEIDHYKVELEFRDGKKKVISMAIVDGEIITPVKDLF